MSSFPVPRSFHLSSFFFSHSFFFFLACISMCYPCSTCPFPAAVDALAYLILLPSRFLSGLFLFILNYVTANFRRVFSTVSLALCFFVASVNDPRCFSPSSLLPRSLLRPRSRATLRAAAAASQSAHGIPRSVSSVPATEQISNK